MTLLELIGVGCLGGLGAMARYALDGGVGSRLGGEFPWGTFAVNLLGSFVLGLFAGFALSREAQLLLGTGLIGAFTTFSTWMLESHRLGEDGRLRIGIANILLSLVLGITAVWVGQHLGAAL